MEQRVSDKELFAEIEHTEKINLVNLMRNRKYALGFFLDLRDARAHIKKLEASTECEMCRNRRERV